MFVWQCIWALGIIREAASAQVSQAPERTTVMAGTDVTFHCTASSVQNNSDVRGYWWRLGDNDLLQPSSDGRKRFFPFKNGTTSFQILSVRVFDSGSYYCGVRYTENTIVNGTGSKLVVLASPEPVRLVPKAAGTNSSTLTLVCETAEFYPESLTFTWYINDINIVMGISTIKKLNLEGMYEASSSLKASQPAQSRAVYTCVVSHRTLQNPAVAVYFDSNSNSVGRPSLNYPLIAGCTASALIFPALVTFIERCCQLNNCKDFDKSAGCKEDGKTTTSAGSLRRERDREHLLLEH